MSEAIAIRGVHCANCENLLVVFSFYKRDDGEIYRVKEWTEFGREVESGIECKCGKVIKSYE